MPFTSVSQIHPTDLLEAQAACIADDILTHTTEAERLDIWRYGKHLMTETQPPTDGTVLRFWHTLHTLAPRLPDYTRLVACNSHSPTAISRLQDAIARCVARSG